MNKSRLVIERHIYALFSVTVDPDQVKDVRLPQNLQRAMAAEAEATREARAKVIVCNLLIRSKNLRLVDLQVIAAEGEQKASRALKEASDIISESPAALQLRFAHNIIHK